MMSRVEVKVSWTCRHFFLLCHLNYKRNIPHDVCVIQSLLSLVDVVERAERMSSQFYYVWPGQGQWEMLVLEALIPQPNKEDTIRIDLLQDP